MSLRDAITVSNSIYKEMTGRWSILRGTLTHRLFGLLPKLQLLSGKLH